MSAPLTFTEKILKFEPIFKYVIKGGLVALDYRKYDRSVHQLQLYGSAQLDIMTQQTKNVEEISITLKEMLKMLKAADEKAAAADQKKD